MFEHTKDTKKKGDIHAILKPSLKSLDDAEGGHK